MRSLLTCLFTAISLIAFSQWEDKKFPNVDVPPEYPGGDTAMIKFIQKNVHYPDMERERGIHGMVVVGFVIDEKGNVSDISIRKGVSKGIDEEAIRVIKLFPTFKPGKQNGQFVKVALVQAIAFKLKEDNGLTAVQMEKVNRKAKSETESINRVVPLGAVYQDVLDICKKDETEREILKEGILTRDLSESQKRALKEINNVHDQRLIAAMGNNLYSKYEINKKGQ